MAAADPELANKSKDAKESKKKTGLANTKGPASATGPTIAVAATRGAKFGDAKKPKKDDITQQANTKVWIKFVGPDGDEQKILLNRGCMQYELRKAVSTMTGVPPRQLNMLVHGAELKEARREAFLNFNPQEDVVTWFRRDRLKSMLKQRQLAGLQYLDKFERTAVHFTVIDGDTELTQEVIDHVEFDMNLMDKQDIFGDTGLMLAAIQGFTDLVELLLDRQAGMEFQNIYGRTAMMMASEHGHHEVVRSLLRAGASSGPNPGTKRPDALYLAKLNSRYKVQKAVRDHQIEQNASAEMDAMMASALEPAAAPAPGISLAEDA